MITATSPKCGYVGDGTTTVFNIPFKFFDASEILVITRVIATGVETVESEGGAYNVTGIDIPAGIPGTDVTFAVAPSSLIEVWIIRALPRTQEVDLSNSVATPMETIEQVFDRDIAIAQEIEEKIGRTVTLPRTSPTTGLTLPEPAAGLWLQWNDDEDGLQNSSLIGVPFDPTGLQDGDLVQYDEANNIWKRVDPSALGIPIGSLTPVDIEDPQDGDVLQFQTDTWTNGPLTGYATSGELTDEVTARSDADTALDGRVTAIEDDYATNTDLETLGGRVDTLETIAISPSKFAITVRGNNPDVPDSGEVNLFFKADGAYMQTDAGEVSRIGGGAPVTQSLSNNQSSAADVTDFPVFNSSNETAMSFFYRAFRRTDTQHVYETMHAYFTWDSEDSAWKVSAGGDAGVEFVATATGSPNEYKLQYKTDDLTGSSYSGSLVISDIQKMK